VARELEYRSDVGFDDLIYSVIKGIHPKRFYETGGLYLCTIIPSNAMPLIHVFLLNAWASSKPPPAAEDRETLKYSEIITFR
jgi:hypothetical protein